MDTCFIFLRLSREVEWYSQFKYCVTSLILDELYLYKFLSERESESGWKRKRRRKKEIKKSNIIVYWIVPSSTLFFNLIYWTKELQSIKTLQGFTVSCCLTLICYNWKVIDAHYFNNIWNRILTKAEAVMYLLTI